MLKKMGESPNLLPTPYTAKLRVKVLEKKGECHECPFSCSTSICPSLDYPIWVDPVAGRDYQTA
jgi:hypothetical protein